MQHTSIVLMVAFLASAAMAQPTSAPTMRPVLKQRPDEPYIYSRVRSLTGQEYHETSLEPAFAALLPSGQALRNLAGHDQPRVGDKTRLPTPDEATIWMLFDPDLSPELVKSAQESEDVWAMVRDVKPFDNSPSSNQFALSAYRQIVLDHLVSPATTKFVDEPSIQGVDASFFGKRFLIAEGEVDSQNRFGALVRSKYFVAWRFNYAKEGPDWIYCNCVIESR